MYRNYFFIYIYLEIIQLVSEILKNERRKFLKQMCCEEGRVLKARPQKAVFYFILLLYCIILLFYCFFERDEAVGYINAKCY